jgi:putative phosphoribosyl transferase
MRFADREDAGRKLGLRLREAGVHADLVLGLPRGGVVVAAQVAQELALPLGVEVVRKIGHPGQREFAVGALAEGGVIVLDHGGFGSRVWPPELSAVIEEETARLHWYQTRFHPEGPPVVGERSIVLVDDGLATGATCAAAAQSVRQRGARWILVAAPVASTHAFERMKRVAEEVRVLTVDPEFQAVGCYYGSFSQTTDEEVLHCLRGR